MEVEMNAIAHPSAGSVSGSKLDNRRMLAALIDLSVVAAGAAVIFVAAGVLGGDGAGVGAPLAAVVVGWALYYYFACESGGGQTLGKKLMNVRVVRVDGSPVGIGDVAVRTVLRVVDTVIVGLVTMLATGERRARVGDLVAKTMIVASDGSPAAAAPAAAPVEGSPEVTPMSEVPVELAVAEAAVVEAPVAEAPVAEAPVAEQEDAVADEPEAEDPADELVAEAPVAMPAPEAPAVPELRPFEPFAEPAPAGAPDEEEASVEPVSDGPVVLEPVMDEPAEDEPVGDEPGGESAGDEPVAFQPVGVEPLGAEPVAAEPVVSESPVELSVVDPPALDEVDSDEPVASADVQSMDIATPSLKELARDVAAASGSASADAEPADEAEVNVKPVETVSAMDLIMGDDESEQDEPKR
jgi:uncharacterized RDD family membrane protein YckC